MVAVPELPEMQALAERLDAVLHDVHLEGAEPLGFSALKSVQPDPSSFEGRLLVRVGRRGKYLVFDFDGPRILVHLSQAGRVVIEDPPRKTRPKGGVVRLRFEMHPSILVKEFGTERKAGWWTLDQGDEGPLAKLGPEPDSREFADLVRTTDDNRRLHTILRDQRTVAGIGRGYADDILHRAALSPFAQLRSLGDESRERLLEAVRGVLDEALGKERRRTGGLPPKLGDHFTVHNRYGHPCPTCEDNDLRRVSFESYEITYCPTCQTGGKVLADRRMSRLIK